MMKALYVVPFLISALILYSCEKDSTEKNSHRIKQILTNNVDANDTKSVFMYDGSKLTSVVHSELNEFGNWNEYFKAEMEYGSGKTINTYYEMESGSWQMTGKSEYIVEEGLITEEINYNFENFSWEEDWKWNYQYSGTNLTAWQSYDANENGFLDQDGKGDYLYNNNKLSEYLAYDMNDLGNWVPYDKETFTYTGDNLTSWVDHFYDESSQWIRSFKCEQTYSGNQITGAYYYDWDSESNSWEISVYYSETYTYNSNGYLTKLIENDGTQVTYEYEEGHGNAKYFWYYPETLVYGQATLKSSSKKIGEYIPYYERIRR